MRMVPTNSLRPHCTLAIDVLDEHSQILLKQGHLLTDKTIAQLKRADLACVYIIDSYSKSLTPTYTALPHNIISRITALNDIGKLTLSGSGNQDSLLKAMYAVNDIVYSLSIEKQNHRLTYEPNKLLTKSTVESNIYIAITTTLFALKLGWNPNDTVNLCLAILLRDIGLLSPNIDAPMDRSLRTKHPIVGAEYLEKSYGLPEDILDIIRQHHESYDGTGFPNKLYGDDICKGARLLKIVDSYYAVQEKLWYTPSRASLLTEDLERRTPTFDPVYLSLFMHNVDIYHIDMLLQLTCGDIGIVTRTYKSSPLTPTVTIIKSSEPSRINQKIKIGSTPEFNIKSFIYYVD